MRTRILSVFLVLGLLGTSNAFASRARLLVIGTGDAGTVLGTSGNSGSFAFDDSYNIFYNPSYVNDYKDWGIIEKSNFPGSSAQGGMVASMGMVNLGVYFNRVAGLMGTYSNNNGMRPIDIMVGGDAGMKWGLGLTWGSIHSKTLDKSDTNMTLRAGVQIADFEPFVAFQLAGSDNLSVAGTEEKNKMMSAGLRYKWGEWTPYLVYSNMKTEVASVSTTTQNVFGLGLGRSTKIGEGAKMMYSLAVIRNAANHENIVPINFAVEGDVASWLVARAGLGYRFIDQIDGTSVGDSTTGRVGAAIKWGKAELEWAFGKNAVSTTSESAGSTDQQTFDIGSGFFTAAAVSYKW